MLRRNGHVSGIACRLIAVTRPCAIDSLHKRVSSPRQQRNVCKGSEMAPSGLSCPARSAGVRRRRSGFLGKETGVLYSALQSSDPCESAAYRLPYAQISHLAVATFLSRRQVDG